MQGWMQAVHLQVIKNKMADETKARMITSVVGLVLAFFGLILSVNGFPTLHTSPMTLGFKLAIFITGMVMAYVSVMPTPAKYQTQQVKPEIPAQQAQPAQKKKRKVTDILLGIAMVFMAMFFIFLSQSTYTIILSLIIAVIGIWLIIASMPEKKKI